MSAVNSIFTQGERTLIACGHGDELTVLSGVEINKKFVGRLDVETALNLDGLLSGNDPRMESVARFERSIAPRLAGGDILTDGITRWRVVKLRDNDASSITVDYEVQQMT